MFFRQEMPLGIILVEVLFFLPQEKLDQKKKIASTSDNLIQAKLTSPFRYEWN